MKTAKIALFASLLALSLSTGTVFAGYNPRVHQCIVTAGAVTGPTAGTIPADANTKTTFANGTWSCAGCQAEGRVAAGPATPDTSEVPHTVGRHQGTVTWTAACSVGYPGQATRDYDFTAVEGDCQTLTEGLDIGSILTLTLNSPLSASASSPDGFCHYDVDKSIDFTMNLDLSQVHDKFTLGNLALSRSLVAPARQFRLSFDYNKTTQQFRNAHFVYEPDADTHRWDVLNLGIQIELTKIDLATGAEPFTPADILLDGAVTFKIWLDDNLSLYPEFGPRSDDELGAVVAYIAKMPREQAVEVTLGVQDFSADAFTFSSTEPPPSLTWDFSGLNLSCVFQKTTDDTPVVLATAAAWLTPTFTADITFIQGETPAVFTTNQFTVAVKNLVAQFTFDPGLPGLDMFKVTSFSGNATISEMEGLEGTLELTLSKADAEGAAGDALHATLTLGDDSTVNAFGFKVSEGTIAADFTIKFDLAKLVGTRIKMERKGFRGADGAVKLSIAEFEIANGALTKLKLNASSLKYKTFLFKFTKAAYESGKLTFTDMKIAMKLFGATQEAAVSKFTIGTDGVLEIGTVTISLTLDHNTKKKKTPDLQVVVTFPEDQDVANIAWDGELALGKYLNFDVTLNALALTVKETGTADGSLTLTFAVDPKNPPTVPPVTVTGGQGRVTITFANAVDWSKGVSWDFSGIKDITAEVRRGNEVLATLGSGKFTGNVFSATFETNGTPTLDLGAGKVTLNEFNVPFKYDFDTDGFDLIKDGTAKAKVAFEGPALSGPWNLELTLNRQDMAVTLDGTNTATIFGMTIANLNVTSTLTYAFEMTALDGSLDATHPALSTALEGISFSYANSTLESFAIRDSKVVWNGFELALKHTQYTPGKLTIRDAKLNVAHEALTAACTNFCIADSGAISVESVSGAINKPPLVASFSATYSDNPGPRFQGQCRVTFQAGADVTVEASVDIGKDASDFVFAKFEGTATGINVPIPNTGLKVTGVALKFGYNYRMPTEDGAVADPFALSGYGTPAQGECMIGLGLGVGDVAGMMNVKGYAGLIVGAESVMVTIKGSIQVPANHPNFTGTLTATHTIGSKTVSGSLASTIKIPAATGSVVDIANAAINYQVSGNRFSVATPNPVTGLLMGHIELRQGTLSFNGNLTDPSAMSGSLGAILKYTTHQIIEIPNGFDPTTPETADATDNAAGFGFRGELRVLMSGATSIQVASGDINGSFNLNVGFLGLARIKLPWLLGGYIETPQEAYFVGDLAITKQDSNLHVTGQGTFACFGYGWDEDFDFNVNWE